MLLGRPCNSARASSCSTGTRAAWSVPDANDTLALNLVRQERPALRTEQHRITGLLHAQQALNACKQSLADRPLTRELSLYVAEVKRSECCKRQAAATHAGAVTGAREGNTTRETCHQSGPQSSIHMPTAHAQAAVGVGNWLHPPSAASHHPLLHMSSVR